MYAIRSSITCVRLEVAALHHAIKCTCHSQTPACMYLTVTPVSDDVVHSCIFNSTHGMSIWALIHASDGVMHSCILKPSTHDICICAPTHVPDGMTHSCVFKPVTHNI